MSRRIIALVTFALILLLPAVSRQGMAAEDAAAVGDLLKNAGSTGGSGAREFLEPDKAFIASAIAKDTKTVTARWEIAPGYYLYRDKFSIKLDHPDVKLGAVTLPEGTVKDDPEFGKVAVFHDTMTVDLPLTRSRDEAVEVILEVGYQGCAEAGICYPPMKKKLPIQLPAVSKTAAVTTGSSSDGGAGTGSEVEGIARHLQTDSLAWTLASFFGIGVLLAFTPCVFPMVPILSGIIAGRSISGMTTRGAMHLSLIFVLAMAFTYAVAGVLAGLFGQNLQATLQNKWALSAFAGIFVLLALSMFGLFKLQLPTSWQGSLTAASNRQIGGRWYGIATMGFLSALIVGPCVTPALAGALMYIGQSGDAALGGSALFAMGLGMGVPLLVVGTSAGKFLPRAGLWMRTVQSVFGALLLGVALWLLERVLPAPLILFLWGLLLIVSAMYLGVFDKLVPGISGWRRLSKGLGFASLVYGVALIVGAAAGGNDIFQPLQGMRLPGTAVAIAPIQEVRFLPIKGLPGLEAALKAARGKPVLLDFYADWCVECKQMEKHTFTDTQVRQAMTDLVLLQADVTANDDADQALMKSFDLYGPPATLFFGPDGVERRSHRLVGFIAAGEFYQHLEQAVL